MAGKIEKPLVPNWLPFPTDSAKHDRSHIVENAANAYSPKILKPRCQGFEQNRQALFPVDGVEQLSAMAQNHSKHVNFAWNTIDFDRSGGPIDLNLESDRRFKAPLGLLAFLQRSLSPQTAHLLREDRAAALIAEFLEFP